MAGRCGFQVRAAASGDAPSLAELFAAAGMPISSEILAKRVTALQRAGAVLLATGSGPPSGVVALSWSSSLRRDCALARIDLLLVAPIERRRGVGRLLLKSASQTARAAGCCQMQVEADPDGVGTGLEAFCAATGFEEMGVRFVRALRKKG